MTSAEKQKRAELQAEIDKLNLLIEAKIRQIIGDFAAILERATNEKRTAERPQNEHERITAA